MWEVGQACERKTYLWPSLSPRTCYRYWKREKSRNYWIACYPSVPYPLPRRKWQIGIRTVILGFFFTEPVGIKFVWIFPHIGVTVDGEGRHRYKRLKQLELSTCKSQKAYHDLTDFFIDIPPTTASSVACLRSKCAGGYNRRAGDCDR